MKFTQIGRAAIFGLVVAAVAVFAAGCKEKVHHHHAEPTPPPRPCPVPPQPQPSPMQMWTEISGRVFIDAKPCKDATITVFWGKGRCYKKSCQTNKKGDFVICEIPPKREIAIEFRGRHHEREYFSARSMWTGRAGDIIELGRIDLFEVRPQPRPQPMPGPVPGPKPAPHPKPTPGPMPHPEPVSRCDLKISGCVMFEGRPAQNAAVRITSGRIYERTVKTDDRGRFRVADVPRHARIEIFAEQKKHHLVLVGSAVIQTGDNNVDIGPLTLFTKKKKK
ncbi:MAG TPA: hypothetical protein PKK48_00050 [Phycisphaerae bacterium]|nr:hypothetical protein [Phycisphaerae bacterium]